MHLPSLALFILAAISAAASACNQNSDCGDGKFCGTFTDGKCHILSCAEWYQYQYVGPASHDLNLAESNTETLACKDIDTTVPGSEVFYSSVSYRCQDLLPPPIQTGFNRKCTADGPTFEYTCYELSEGTQFLTFMSEIEYAIKHDRMNCTDDADPVHVYQFSHVEIELAPPKPPHTDTVYGSLWRDYTAEFDKDRATTGTLYPRYIKIFLPPNTAPLLTASKSKSGKKSKVLKSKKAKASKSKK